MGNGESSYRRFLAGDNEGMLEIVCEYQAGLILYLNSYVQDIHMAGDLAEDPFSAAVLLNPALPDAEMAQRRSSELQHNPAAVLQSGY